MITKKELLFFALAVSAVAGFVFSGITNTPNHKTFKNIQEKSSNAVSFKRTYDQNSLRQVIRNKKTAQSISAFRRKLKTQSSNQKLAALTSHQEVGSKVNAPTKKTAKKDKKKDDKKKKSVAKKGKGVPITPTFPDEKEVSKDNFESKDLASKSTGSFLHTRNANTEQNEESEELQDEENTVANVNSDSLSAGVTAQRADDVNSSSSNSIYTNLLEQGKFADFEQILQTSLSESERVKSYTDSVNFLFSQTGENSEAIDTFIVSQFKNHRHAVVISKSLSNESFNTEKLAYSVELLTSLVASWSPQQDSNQFKTIYQETVASNIPTTDENQELFTTLQSSIELKYVSLTNSSIEIVAN